MHALVPILIAANNKHEQNLPTITKTTTTDESGIMSETKAEDTERMSALEAKAVAEATATADRAFTPSPSLLNSASPTALLKQVDGPSLANYKDTESVYVGRSIPVSAGSSLSVPIQVNTPGSIVEYAAENKSHDIGFGITAEREEGITIVQVRFSWCFCLFCLSFDKIKNGAKSLMCLCFAISFLPFTIGNV